MSTAHRTPTSLAPDASRTVTYIHIGDTHLTRDGEQNEVDLGRIVDEINEVYAKGGVDFVFVPGDIADDGSVRAYEVFRRHLDRLQLPWIGIVGDHDVHEKSFDNFKTYVSPELYGSFTAGPYRFLLLNAFSVARPDSFAVDDEQLDWLETQLGECAEAGQRAVVFLHCYPSDLKVGSEALSALLRGSPVLLVDMGHTHYNELSNDGSLLYGATRSTGQIEEGPVGYSVVTLDGDTVSWQFVELGKPALACITQPADRRLVTVHTEKRGDDRELRVKVWAPSPVNSVTAQADGKIIELKRTAGALWTARADEPLDGEVTVTATCSDGSTVIDRIECGTQAAGKRSLIDHENALDAWPERGLLGTQLGPNKNGRKW